MRTAIELARGVRAHPNPTVGCLVIDTNGEVVGRGIHRGPGTPHAEIEALAEAGDRAAGATVVVTLEPCSHSGRTPACTDALQRAGVARVFYGAIDPDERVEGAKVLAAHGIEVIGPTDPAAIEEVDPGYFHHRRTGLPLITLKAAMTLDGSVAALDGTSQWITDEVARADVHELRATVDAVMIGAGTLRADDPLLDVRLDSFTGPQPRPIIVAGRAPLPENARIKARVPLVVSTAPGHPWGEVIVVDPGPDGYPDPRAAARALAAMGVLTVLLEGGGKLAARFWNAGLIDELVLYYGGLMGGGQGRGLFEQPFTTLEDAQPVTVRAVTRIGNNVRVDCTRS